MGCASSKQGRLDRKSKSLATRSFSLPHNPPKVADGYHVVALTSTTLGSLKLESLDSNPVLNGVNGYEKIGKTEATEEATDFSKEVLQAKTWSSMIEEKIPRIPRTPTLTPPNEPEMINAWELMEGLEDSSPFRITGGFGLERSFSFHTAHALPSDNEKKPEERFPVRRLQNGCLSPKPVAEEAITKSKSTSPSRPLSGSFSPKTAGRQNADSMVTDFDPDLISAFRKALEEMSPHNLKSPAAEKSPVVAHLKSPAAEKSPVVAHLKSPAAEKSPVVAPPVSNNASEKTSLVKARVSDFQKKIDSKKFMKQPTRCPPHGEDKVVFYFTSLRGIRKTYEDCCRVSLILKGFGVRVDDRDVSMHQGFREELDEVLGGSRSLPQLFVKGRYLGDADAVKQLHEAGELEKILEDCQLVEEGASVCETCGDVRFINCETCYGSCKVYYEEEEEEEVEEEEEEAEYNDGGEEKERRYSENSKEEIHLCFCKVVSPVLVVAGHLDWI
ncbi:hypothetical protein H6P81_011186 [Aristolochia fimbriata]|uniref:Glutaredoxin domain-containing protein n=1 Tax=Aristolochia fimbriata TaxID=158543 RepID=A0AAV7ERY2_ARIFI|nr:hypothetical protein H6P81_011186 [Aristolochia fimbriata]